MKFSKNLLIICCLFMLTDNIHAQVYSNIDVDKIKSWVDSAETPSYPYILPIWGDKATELGFDLPYSAGLSINFISQKSEILIDNLMVGVNNSQLFNLDGIVRFTNVEGTTEGVNIRPDVWILPFLNVYGIFAKSKTSTAVDFGVWVPNGTAEEEILNLSTKADFNATSFGFGLTPTVGIGNGFLALDMNFTWTDIPELDDPAFSFIFGPRLGKSFSFKKPERSIAVWVGGFRVNFKSDTNGRINLSEVLPEEGNFDDKVNTGLASIEQRQVELDEWWEELSPAQQKINQLKYDASNRVLQGSYQFLSRLSDAGDQLASSTINYSLDKRLKDRWNFIVGSQFQLNKHWMIRAEVGFLSSRTQIISGLQYRFGL